MDTNKLTTLGDLWESHTSPNYNIDSTRTYVQQTAEQYANDFEASDKDLYASAVFKNLWNKKVMYLGNKEVIGDTWGDIQYQSELFDDSVDYTQPDYPIVFSNGGLEGEHKQRYRSFYSDYNVWTGEAKTGHVWQAYSSLLDTIQNNMPGILASRLSGSAQVLNIECRGTKRNILLTSDPYTSNEATLNEYRGDTADAILDSGVYIVRINKDSHANIKELHHNEKKLFCNQWIYVVDYGATLYLDREIHHTTGVIDNLQIIQYPGSTVKINTHDRGNQWRNIDIQAYQDTTTIVNGSTLLKNSSSANFIDVHHKGNNGNSSIKYKSAIYNSNVGNFIGQVKVDKRAVGTKSIMENKNLLVDPEARAMSKPILNINTKEIECTHGCTTSKIPEDELYYLETLGLDKNSAKSLIANGHIQI